MNDERIKSIFWKEKAPYLFGAIILFVGAFGTHWQSSSTITELKLIWGLVMGVAMWIAFLLPQVIIQFLLRLALRRWLNFSLRAETVILIVPSAFFAALLLSAAYASSLPRSRFEKYVGIRVPESVRNIKQGGSTGVDGVFWAFRFEIDREGLDRIVRQVQFVPANDERGPQYWQRRLQTRAGLSFDVQSPFESYIVRGGGVERRLIYDTSTSVVFLVYCTYSGGA